MGSFLPFQILEMKVNPGKRHKELIQVSTLRPVSVKFHFQHRPSRKTKVKAAMLHDGRVFNSEVGGGAGQSPVLDLLQTLTADRPAGVTFATMAHALYWVSSRLPALNLDLGEQL